MARRSEGAATEAPMRKSLFVFLLVALGWNASWAEAQNKGPATFDLSEFLKRHESSLKQLGQLYGELANENLPMRDETGQPLARRPIEDRQQALNGLVTTVHQLAANPQDMVSATKLLVQSEALADDLYDLIQVAYDNNREELGRQLAELLRVMDRHNALIESYALNLAAEKETRLRELEKENQELRLKLREATEPVKSKTTPQH
jgi:hypothetical protein